VLIGKQKGTFSYIKIWQ